MKNAIFFNLFVALSTFTYAQQQAPPSVRLINITGNIYEVMNGRGAQGGVFIGEDGILVIDSKQDQVSVQQTLDEIRKLSDKPIKYLINTHSDGDHITGNRFFPSNMIFVSHANCRKDFFLPKRDGSPSDWSKPELLPFVPSITFNDKMDLYLGSEKIELWYFGIGHTTGDAVVYFPEEKTAFIGDQVFVGRTQLIHAYKGGNSFEHVKTLTRMLATLDAEKFISGHSELLSREAVQKHIDEMKILQKKVGSLLAENKTLDEIKAAFEKDKSALVEIIFNEIKIK